MKKAKRFLAVLIAGLLAVQITACGGAGSQPPSSTPVQPASTASQPQQTDLGGSGDIHIAAWNDAADSLNAIADQFNAQPGHTGKVIIDEADGQYTKLKPALAAGNGVPDIFQTQNRDIQAFYNNYGVEQFLDLSGLIEPEKANFVEFALSNCVTEDGRYYSIPWDIAPTAMIYRSDVFEAAGIDAAALTTWDKYIEAGKQLKAVNPDYAVEAYCYNGSTGFDQVLIYMNQLGGEYYNDAGNVDLTSAEMLKATDLMLQMVREGVAMDIPDAWGDRIAAINSNKLVSMIYPVWFLGTMKSACADSAGKWALAPIPAFEEGGNNKANAGGSILAVYSGTKNPQLCVDFLKFALMSDAGNDINMAHGLFPSYTPSYATEAFGAADPYVGGQSVGNFFKEYTGAPVTHFGPYFSYVARAMMAGTGNILANGMDPKEAWSAATQEAQRNIDLK